MQYFGIWYNKHGRSVADNQNKMFFKNKKKQLGFWRVYLDFFLGKTVFHSEIILKI